MHKLFSGKVDSYWAIGVPTTAPVPRLIVVREVLWVIKTLHDPSTYYMHPVPGLQSPVPHTLARHGTNAILARLLMYSWVHISVPYLPCSMIIGELYMPPVDNLITYACCNGPCSHAILTYGHYLCSSSHSSHCYCSMDPCGIHTPSHPYGPYRPSSYFTRVPYHVTPCRPLQPGPGLPGSDQRE